MPMSGDLIDTTEMYLKTVYELEEDGIPPLRARIVERLGQSGPTVSETVARLERDGLLRMGAGRQIQFTDEGFRRAEAVMRRHRLAERLLIDVIGLEWVNVHEEACRWEHVVSDSVADKIQALLKNPELDPFGNPIPGVRTCGNPNVDIPRVNFSNPDMLGESLQSIRFSELGVSELGVSKPSVSEAGELAEARSAGEAGISREPAADCAYMVVRLSERLQANKENLQMLDSVGIRPGVQIYLLGVDGNEIRIGINGQEILFSRYSASGVYVEKL